MAATALARRITPVNTPVDGDVVFAASTAAETQPIGPLALLAVGSLAAHALEQAIERAVSVADEVP
jgi:L-aminopeptidase/D-esterase-like protein